MISSLDSRFRKMKMKRVKNIHKLMRGFIFDDMRIERIKNCNDTGECFSVKKGRPEVTSVSVEP